VTTETPAKKVTAESLFRDHFLPLYPEDARADLARARREDANPAMNPTILAHLSEAAAGFVANAKALFGEAAPVLDGTDASIHRLSAALTPEARDRWMAMGAAGTPGNALFNAVVHGAAYVGACIVKNHGGTWHARRPLWESLVHLVSRAGDAELAVFHWWLRSLADDATETLADRYRTLVEIPCATPETLPVLAPPNRRLPRIAKGVRYDVFYKHLKAHLPELRDVGQDFPTPERFADIGFKWLDFHLLGEGRMLLVYGPGEKGLHLFWLTSAGFEKAAFWPSDAFPEPMVRVTPDGAKLEVIVSVDKRVQTHEVLWWGP
jgi:hypothetical protein